MTKLTSAGPAEIVRAKQKDDNFSDRLQKLWLEILLKCSGTRMWMKYRHIPIGHFLYGAATTLSGLQTLGEEYTGIVQVNNSKIYVPNLFHRLLMLVLDNFGNSILIILLSQMEHSVNARRNLSTKSRELILKGLHTMKNVLPFLDRLHRGLFYCGGLYYQISKRCTGIHYVLVRKWLKDYKSLYVFRMLGIITIVHLVAVVSQANWWIMPISSSAHESVSRTKSSYGRKCPLCLEERTNVSATCCGHLFCWTCIMKWLETQNQCPICRERVEPSRIIPLQNYI